MDSRRPLSKPANTNRQAAKEKRFVLGRTRRYRVLRRRATTSTAEGRMEGSANNFCANLQGSPGPMPSTPLVYHMHSPVQGADQVMQMRPLHGMVPAASNFQLPLHHMNGAFQQMLQHPGQVPGQYAGSPHFVHQNYTGGQNGGNEAATQGCQEEDEVQEVPATQVPQPKGKKKGACHRGPGYEVEEDCVLVSGWLNISKDATTGTNQEKEGFYKRLHQYYVANCHTNHKRTATSIQQRWSTIQTRVSKFCAILSRIERFNQSGKSYQDMINDAIKVFQETEPWHYGHCWEMLKDEPKWNNKYLELQQPNNAKNKEPASVTDTPTQSAQEVSSMPPRPEGRDAAKKRAKVDETSSSSVAVDMLKKMHDRGQEMDEVDAKHKEELMSLERAKFDLQQKQWQAKFDMMQEANRMQRELTQEQMKMQKEAIDAQLKLKMQSLEVERMKNDTQIMFTDPAKLSSGLREWVLKRQMDIMIRDGVQPSSDGSDITDSRV